MAPCNHRHQAALKAPNALQGRYKVYKQGTNKLIEFLITAAGRCCDLKTIVHSIKNKITIKKSNKSQPKFALKTSELVKLAQAVADSDPPIDVPESVIQILRDVIAGREECNSWYAAQPVKDDLEEQNETHRYFIKASFIILVNPNLIADPLQVLQRVHELLSKARARFTATHPPPTATANQKKKSKGKSTTYGDTLSIH
jgi:hypothetical protein